MGLFFKNYSDLAKEAIGILQKIKTKIVDGSDFTYTGYENAQKLREEIDLSIEKLRNANRQDLDEIYSHFLPTATFQEHAMANGWSKEYLQLSEKFDKIYKKMVKKIPSSITQVAPQWVRGKSYEVYSRDRDTFIYNDNSGKSLIVYWEAGYDPYNRMIYSSSIKEWTEPNGLSISPIQKKEIKRNCKEAWEFAGVPIVFDE